MTTATPAQETRACKRCRETFPLEAFSGRRGIRGTKWCAGCRRFEVSRHERFRDVRSTTERTNRFSTRKLAVLSALEPYPDSIERPQTRGECQGAARPCPWVSCRYHLFLDVSEADNIKLNFPDLEPDQLETSCALDVADREGATLEEVGDLINVTRERVRQIQTRALEKVERRAARTGMLDGFPAEERSGVWERLEEES